MTSEEKIEEIKQKLRDCQESKKIELLRQVVLLKKLTVKNNTISTRFTNSVYTDVVNDLDSLRGN